MHKATNVTAIKPVYDLLALYHSMMRRLGFNTRDDTAAPTPPPSPTLLNQQSVDVSLDETEIKENMSSDSPLQLQQVSSSLSQKETTGQRLPSHSPFLSPAEEEHPSFDFPAESKQQESSMTQTQAKESSPSPSDVQEKSSSSSPPQIRRQDPPLPKQKDE